MSGNSRQPAVDPNPPDQLNISKYISAYVLLVAGIIGGILLVLSLFIICRYCRSRPPPTSAAEDETGVGRRCRGVESESTPHSLRSSEERRSSTRSRYAGGEILLGFPEGRDADVEEGCRCRVSPPPRTGEDHGKPSVLLQRQISVCRHESSYSPAADRTECEVAVEIHSSGEAAEGDSPAVATEPQPRLEWEQVMEDGEAVTAASRVPSTDWTPLESSLDFWQLEHSRAQETQDDDEPYSKVRYNDTGSLEEVNVDQLVDYYVEDEEIVLQSEENMENLRMQYRRLWELRATLEEDEELSEMNQSKQRETSFIQSRSSPDQSPELEAATSHTASFESNTEPLLEDRNRCPPHLLHLPSYEVRRQTYRNILCWRLRRLEARKHQGRQPSLEDTSFDSIDTVDTEGSSTDVSRLEQATTSFESTTDNTDSTGEGQAHRLQQLRADSGYRSLENPPAPKLSHRQRPLIDSEDRSHSYHHLSLSDSAELEPTPGKQIHQHPSLGDSGDLEMHHLISLGESGSDPEIIPSGKFGSHHLTLGESVDPEPDEGVAGLQSPPAVEPLSWESKRKSCTRSASKKRREFGGGRLATAVVSGDFDPSDHYFRQHCHQTHTYTRDYSVDEKSDALFREFSRCEPSPSEIIPRQRLSGSSYRRLHQSHGRHSHYPNYPYPHPDPARKFSDPRSSIEEEYPLTLPLPLRYTDDDRQMATVPRIHVADEHSSDHM